MVVLIQTCQQRINITKKTLLDNKEKHEELPPVVIPEAEEVPGIVLVQFLLVVVLRQEGFLH
jgi:hypothetical protein